MKKLSLFLLLVSALVAVYWFKKPAVPVPAPSPPTETSIQTPVAPETKTPAVGFHPRSVMISQPSPTASEQRNIYAKKPVDGNINFKVIGGLAVAYGDTLLGKVPPDFSGLFGLTESPRIQLWDKPEIPYAINPSLPDPQRVEKALDYLRQHTVLQFIPYDGQKDAIVFEPGDEECLSYLGRIGGAQPIRLVPGCHSQEILHEVLHALGFIHEQSRPDRDQYVDILWDNIQENFQSQFAMVPDSLAETERDSPFDYQSIMMYRPSAFALHPGLNTMQAHGGAQINPVTDGLSPTDLARINRLYSGQ